MKDQELIKKLENYMDDHTDELVKDIVTLCSINSVKAAPEPGMPYGKGAHTALMKAEELCRTYGFETQEYDDRVISADLNRGEKCLDILAHMDVVAAGDGWTKTEAFSPKVEGDMIYGRGTSDDKGPAMAALYAMRAVKELGIPLKGQCRLILGSDEECGSSDIPHYYEKEPEAPMTFSPDAEFPVTNIEKGQFRGFVRGLLGEGNAEANAKARRLLSLKSGDTINIVPGKGEAIVSGFEKAELEKAAEAVRGELKAGFGCEISETEEGFRIFIVGKAAHASAPENGVNAALILIRMLSRLSFTDRKLKDHLKKLAELFPFGDYCGAGLGIDLSDIESGKTTLSADILALEDNFLCLSFDARTCVLADEDNTLLKAARRLMDADFAFTYTFNPPHVVQGDSEFIHTLLEQYTAVTGKPGYCRAIGGGSYVHGFENGVTFGAVGETTDTHMHGADEFVRISEMKQAAVVFAMSIIRLCS